ncbi:MAG: radical SAM protein, partial [Nanoarchaeota archaeon]|nr:radical SAM protein [Nanoarchaeota archaeon]
MKNVLLVYVPFCTPASPPYSITNLYSFLKSNCKDNISVLDLNLEFHKIKFASFSAYYHDFNKWDNYNEVTDQYRKLTVKTYSENNKRVVKGEKPELFEELLGGIIDRKPEIVAFSIVYSSQAFYAFALVTELTKRGIKCVLGGPAVNDKLKAVADKVLENEIELLSYIQNMEVSHDRLNFNYALDYSVFDLKDYFTPYPVIPLKATTTCYYKGCTFCNHFKKSPYMEYSLEMIEETVVKSNGKYFFLIDDMIPLSMLLKISKVFLGLNIKWCCQLRPTKELTLDVLQELHASGLILIIWGVESGNDRVLKLMNKGTNKEDIQRVLAASHNGGIKNIVYIIFGFPTETKEE